MLGSARKGTKTYSVRGGWSRATTQKVQGRSVELTARTMPLFSCTRKELVETVPFPLWRSGDQISQAGEEVSTNLSSTVRVFDCWGSERDVVDLPLPGTCYSGFGMVRAPGPCTLVKLLAAIFFGNLNTAK